MSKHTPGPWVADAKGKPIFIPLRTHHCEKIGFSIGFVSWDDDSLGAPLANARLIAAAPRMSDTLKRAAHILAELPDQSPQLIALRSQIVQCIKQATPEYYSVTQAE